MAYNFKKNANGTFGVINNKLNNLNPLQLSVQPKQLAPKLSVATPTKINNSLPVQFTAPKTNTLQVKTSTPTRTLSLQDNRPFPMRVPGSSPVSTTTLPRPVIPTTNQVLSKAVSDGFGWIPKTAEGIGNSVLSTAKLVPDVALLGTSKLIGDDKSYKEASKLFNNNLKNSIPGGAVSLLQKAGNEIAGISYAASKIPEAIKLSNQIKSAQKSGDKVKEQFYRDQYKKFNESSGQEVFDYYNNISPTVTGDVGSYNTPNSIEKGDSITPAIKGVAEIAPWMLGGSSNRVTNALVQGAIGGTTNAAMQLANGQPFDFSQLGQAVAAPAAFGALMPSKSNKSTIVKQADEAHINMANALDNATDSATKRGIINDMIATQKAKALANSPELATTKYNVNKVNSNEAYTLSDYAEMLNPNSKFLKDTTNPSIIDSINQLNQQARNAANTAGIDITSGSKMDIQNRIIDFMEQYDNAQNPSINQTNVRTFTQKPDQRGSLNVGQIADDLTGKNKTKITVDPTGKLGKETPNLELRQANVDSAPQLYKDQQPLKISEDDYLKQRGAGPFASHDPAMDNMMGAKPNAKAAYVKMAQDKSMANYELSTKLRQEYQTKVKNGEIIEPTIIDRALAQVKNGNPESTAVQASKRLLEKQGIDWKTGEKLSNPTPQVTKTVPKEIQGKPIYRGINETEWKSLQEGGVSHSVNRPDSAFVGTDRDLAVMAAEAQARRGRNTYIVEYKPGTENKIIAGGSLGHIQNPNNIIEGEYLGKNLGLNDISKVTDSSGKVIYDATTPIAPQVTKTKVELGKETPKLRVPTDDEAKGIINILESPQGSSPDVIAATKKYAENAGFDYNKALARKNEFSMFDKNGNQKIKSETITSEKPKVTLQEGRANQVLDKKIRYNGKVMTRSEYIDALKSDGYTPIQNKVGGKTKYSMKSQKGDYYDISKIEYDKASSTPQVTKTPLHDEALKYNSADEFINSKQKLYHGSPYDFDEFKNQTTYFTPDEKFARQYSDSKNIDQKIHRDTRIYETYHNGENLFDYKNASDITKLNKSLEDKIYSVRSGQFGYFMPSNLTKKQVIESIKNGDWAALENPEINKIVKKLGFEGHIADELGAKTVAIYEPNKMLTPEKIEILKKQSQELTDIYNQAHHAPQVTKTPLYTPKSDIPAIAKQVTKTPTELPIAGKPLTTKEKVLSSKPVEYLFGDKLPVKEAINTKDYIKQQNKLQDTARKQGQANPIVRFKNEATSKILDNLSPIERTMNRAIKNGTDIPLSQNIIPQLDRALRSDTIAGQYIKDKGLAKVIQNVPDTKALDQYLIAKHAVDLEANGVKTGRNLAKDTQLVASLKDTYEPHAKEVLKYNQQLLDKAVDYGLVSKETATMLKKKYPNYVPANRIFGDGELNGFKGNGSGKASISTQSVVQKIKGSERQIESPLASIVNKTNDVISQGERNKAASILASYKDLPDNPFNLRELGKGETVGTKSTISYLDNGVKRTFETTPEIAAAAKALNKEQVGIIGKILRVPTRLLRLGATGLNPAFALANITKDLVSAAINSEHPLRSSVLNPKVLKQSTAAALYHKGKSYAELVREGAGGTSFDIARDTPKQNIKTIRSDKNVATKTLYTVTHPAELFRAVENTIGRSEEFSRALQYFGNKDAAIKKGLSSSDATIYGANAARNNTVNFARHGDYGAVLNSALPYLNAGVQGSRTFVRNVKNRPVQTLAKVALLSTLPTVTVTMWNLSDPKRKEAYDDISDYEKEGNLIILPPKPVKDPKTGKWNAIKIPVSQEISNLNNIARNGVEAASGDKNFDVKQTLGDLIGTTTSINAKSTREVANQVIPQALKPTIETLTNQNLFTGNKIVPDSQKNLPANEQFGQYTSGTAKTLGSITGISPRVIDNTIKTTTGGSGQNAINLSDTILAKAGVTDSTDIQGKSIIDSITGRFSGASAKPVTDTIEKKFTELRDKLIATPEYKALSKDDQRKAVNRLQTDISAIEYNINDTQNPNNDYTPTKLTTNQVLLANGDNSLSKYLTPTGSDKITINKDAFDKSGANFLEKDGYVYRRNSDGSVATPITKNEYDYKVGTATLTKQKRADDVNGWIKTANTQIDRIQKQLDDPTVDELDKLQLQDDAQVLIDNIQKYTEYGGFTKPKSSSSKSASIAKILAANKNISDTTASTMKKLNALLASSAPTKPTIRRATLKAITVRGAKS